MNKLTQLEAQLVIQEAYRLKGIQVAQHGLKYARLGQCIHWAANIERGTLPFKLANSLADLLDSDHATVYDFYHWTAEDTVLECFYDRYVEE